MTNIKQLLVEIIGEWEPIAVEGSHFQGIDFQWLASAAIVGVVFVGLFGIVRAFVRR